MSAAARARGPPLLLPEASVSTVDAPGVTLFAEGRNLANSIRSASVQVDNAAGRYFEPADRRAEQYREARKSGPLWSVWMDD